MWTLVRTITILLVICASIEFVRPIKPRVVTVKRVKFRTKSGNGTTRNAVYLDKLTPERRARCRRYAQQYFGQPVITDFNQYPKYFIRPPFLSYVPSKCYNYCLDCPTSSCRRRCPATLPATPTPSQACNCDPNGSKYFSCDPASGNCICKPHYEGRTCSVCKPGYWKTLKKDCIKCHCNEYGAVDSVCNQENGQCTCKPGITGQNCDQCLPNYYGTVETGCIECEPCNRKGHVCGKGGKCLCPTLTIGKECERCAPNSWGYEPSQGCKSCNCSHPGSTNQQCDKNSGLCTCKVGYEGTRCNTCAFGYYGYPNCRKCLCNAVGTLETECQGNDCQCNEDGGCNCKENVHGSKCNVCKSGTFGLAQENPMGCKHCFCFGRSNQCVDTKYNWDKIRYEKFGNGIENNEPISSDIISLPKRFMGDLTTSYDGYLSVNGTGGHFSVFLTGNGISLRSELTSNELRLNERHWRVTSGNNAHRCQVALGRECLLLVLQNVTSIVVQGQDMEIVEVLLDSAKQYIPYNRTSHSVEKCDCPSEYTGLSCQDPNEGYYRYFPQEHEITQTPWIDHVIGVARPCECNGHSKHCDGNTGHCKNCQSNTAGIHCEQCATGYYQDHNRQCQPCLCPSEFDNNAESCVAKKNGFQCHCKKGYTGAKCDQCKESYFRDAHSKKCTPCNCNSYGSYSSICNFKGKCECRPGFQGDKCNQCKNPREFIKDGICAPCDECTQLLFNDIDRLGNALESVNDLLKDGVKPPWKILESLKVRYKFMNKTFHYKIDKANTILRTVPVKELEDRVLNIGSNVNNIDREITDLMKVIEQQYGNVTNFLQELNTLKRLLVELTNDLKDFGKRHVDIEGAVRQAVQMLNDIQKNIARRVEEVALFNQPIYEYCARIDHRAKEIYQKPPFKLPYEDIKELNNKLDELDWITAEVEKNTSIAEDYLNNIALNRLNDRIEELEDLMDRSEDNLDETRMIIANTKEKLGDLTKIISSMENFDSADYDKLKTRLDQFDEESPYLDDLVLNASEHVQKLKKMVDDRIHLLNFTDDETKKIETSGAYGEIIDGIASARVTAEEADKELQKACRIMHPEGSDTLIDKANLAHSESDRLKHRIDNMANISNALNAKKRAVDQFKLRLIDSSKLNNNLSHRLVNLEERIINNGKLVERLHQAMDDSSRIIDNMSKMEKDISNLNITVRYDLFNEKNDFDRARTEADQEIKNAQRNVNEAMRKVTEFLEDNKPIDDTGIKSDQRKLDSVSAKIKELQDKILYARQAAESVNVAMGLSNCSMFYSMPQSEVFRSLAITYKCANCHLFKWERGGLSIRIKNGQAILKFSKDHDEITTDDKSGGTKMEKTLFIQRTGSLLQMKFENDTNWKKVSIGNKLLVLESGDRFEIGDGKFTQNNPYVYKVSINDQNVGLWKFVRTNGMCKGQARVHAKELDGARTFYAGNGYRSFEKAPLSPAKFNLQFYFASFDENSLIYLAQETDNPHAFISLTLDEGYVKLDVRHNNNKSISVRSKEKLNDGKTNSVDIAMAYNNKIQYYSLETKSTKESIKEPLDNKAVFRIKRAVHYVGGIPPTMPKADLTVNTRSFLGFLYQPAILSNELVSSGVTLKVGELELDKAWFNGNGTLDVLAPLPRSRTTQKLSSVSFVLRPLIANAAILDIANFGTLTLSDRLLQINLINGEHYLVDKKMALHINDYNVVSVMFKSDKISLTVNDKDETIYRNKSDNIFKEDAIEMTVGSTEGFDSFYGGISDISLNDKELFFTSKTVTSFSNVDIGREMPLVRPTITLKGLVVSPTHANNLTNSMQNTQGCATTANYQTDPTAVNLGDQRGSYIRIKSGFWKKDFKLQFAFRTFYADGMIFISVGSTSPPHYNFLQLEDGRITFHVKGKRKIPKNWPITFTKKVNDGQWHIVSIIKKNGKKLQMSLDDEVKKPVRIPRTTVRNDLFVGNVPNGYVTFKELRDRIRPFKGCINNLTINDEAILLGINTSDVSYKNIRQCFPIVEEGAYFGGDAYAIYKEGFRINKNLDFSFEFRTAEQNGILLTVSNEGNTPALSLELQNGAVAMTVDLGNGVQTNVTNNLYSDFALCNNMWHNITAIYTSSELTVIVDGIRKSWVQSDVGTLMDEVDAPLYVGGLPDNAAVGTLKTRENFKGCIKNLRIDNNLKEWSEMEELNGILLNSCPAVQH